MKTKLLIFTAFMALACVSCGREEISESVNAPKSSDNVNAVDKTATEKGNTPAYEVHVKKTDKNGKINEHTEIKNCFNDILFADEYSESEYEYKYNSDGLILEEKSSVPLGDYSVETLDTYQYDEHGEMTLFYTVRSAVGALEGEESGFICINEYDDAGKLIRTEYSDTYYNDEKDEDEESVTVVEFKYDSNGHITEMVVDRKHKTVFEYDSKGNGIRELQTVIKDGEEKRGIDIYTAYNSRDLPETQEWFKNDELVLRYEYEYTFYDEQGD